MEEAKVDWALPGHVLSRWPNKMEPSDFEGWVQERGLYFANPADPRYELPLTCHDPGEPERPGGLVYSRYGQGVFIYTGYSFFRELPAGVPGALKLFVNLVSSGQAPR